MHLPKDNQRVFSILLVSSSESDDSFPYQFSFTDSFETQGLCMYGYHFVKSDKYSSSKVSLFSVLLFSSFEALFIVQTWTFLSRNMLSSKLVLSFLSLLNILHKKALSAIVFFSAIMSIIRK